MGFTKTGGNYAASILAGDIAEKKGYEQVLWLDGKENKYIEEVGSMNMFFKFKDALVTPPLLGSILGGITRDSIIKLAKHKGIPVDERRITVQDVFDAADNGTLEEALARHGGCRLSGGSPCVEGSRDFHFRRPDRQVDAGFL